VATKRFSSLYIGILAATGGAEVQCVATKRFSSLYIGILAATNGQRGFTTAKRVSVPFTSGSSLQPTGKSRHFNSNLRFSSLYIGILAATDAVRDEEGRVIGFSSLYIGILAPTVSLNGLLQR